MVARSKKDIEKAHELNRKVRREKARLRKRGPKKHSRYDKMVNHVITLTPEMLAKVNEEAKKRGISPQRVVKEAIRKMVKADWEKYKNGIQEKPDIKMDEDTKQ